MRILIFSDIHLHNWPYGSTLVDGMNSRLKAQADALNQIALASEEADHVVFCGDLFHTHGKIDAAVLKVAWEGFSRIAEQSNTYIDVLVGNHDTSDKSMKVHDLHWMKAFNFAASPGQGNIFRIIDRPIHNWKDAPTWEDNFSFLPYTEDKAVIEKFFSECGEVCFMHQGVSEVPMGSGFLIDEILTTDMIPSHVKHVFTGHYHQHNKVADNLTVVGSTMQHNWSDEGDPRGYVWYDTETGGIELRPLDAPMFETLHLNYTSARIDEHENVAGNFIRVTGHDTKNQEDIRKELTEAGALSVEFVQETVDVKRLGTPSTPDGFHLPSLVAEYEKQQEVDDERSKVGKEIMK